MCKCFIHVVAYVGTEVLFRCRATGLPTPGISWRKGSIPVSSLDLDRMQILPNGDLRVENITEDDNDVYTCIATNFVGPMETKEARLAVIVPVSVSVSPNNVTVSPGDDVKITCSSRGTPRPIVEWYKDDTFMGSQGRTRVSRTSVIISQVQPSDSGYYQCQARHNYGSASDKMYLNVVVERGNVRAFLIINLFYKRVYHFVFAPFSFLWGRQTCSFERNRQEFSFWVLVPWIPYPGSETNGYRKNAKWSFRFGNLETSCSVS